MEDSLDGILEDTSYKDESMLLSCRPMSIDNEMIKFSAAHLETISC